MRVKQETYEVRRILLLRILRRSWEGEGVLRICDPTAEGRSARQSASKETAKQGLTLLLLLLLHGGCLGRLSLSRVSCDTAVPGRPSWSSLVDSQLSPKRHPETMADRARVRYPLNCQSHSAHTDSPWTLTGHPDPQAHRLRLGRTPAHAGRTRPLQGPQPSVRLAPILQTRHHTLTHASLTVPADTHTWTVFVRSAASPNTDSSKTTTSSSSSAQAAATAAASAARDRSNADDDLLPGGADDMSYFLKRVSFRLHDSFPTPLRSASRFCLALFLPCFGGHVLYSLQRQTDPLLTPSSS